MQSARVSPTRSPRLRFGARVIVLDPANRVLLFRHADEPDGPAVWVPPGGGTEGNETAEATAHRELWEETGLRVVGPLIDIGRRHHIVTWGGVCYDSRQHWFLARVPAGPLDTSGFTDLERITIHEYRWWTVDELAATAERLVPTNLAALVRTLLTKGPPTTPLDLED